MTAETGTSVGLSTASAGALLVLATIPAADAPAFAGCLVEEGRAACVNPLPGIRSTYRWNAQIEAGDEALLPVKTTVAGYPALERRVFVLHPVEVPEILALPVVDGFGPYLEWLSRSVTPA